VPKHGVLNVQAFHVRAWRHLPRKGDELVWVTDLDATGMRNQFRLQPGTYTVTYRSRNATRTELSLDREVTIESGRSTTVNF
jgi:hypothetical protein